MICNNSLNGQHRYFDGACLNCGQETPERTMGTYEFTTDELRVLYNLIEHEYIPYENEAAHAVINKISKIIKENE